MHPFNLLEHFKKKELDVSLGSCHGNSCTEICAHGEGGEGRGVAKRHHTIHFHTFKPPPHKTKGENMYLLCFHH